MLHKTQFEFLHDHIQENHPTSTPEKVANSSVSYDDDINTQLPKKRRGGNNKKILSVVIGGGDDPRSKAEIHPPQDSWSWRKYGQKPIKGSPYPRGYYRCSSSKGCPAKKQVERSCLDPNILLVTYSGEHNHSQSRATKLHRISHLAAAAAVAASTAISIATSNSTSSSSNASDVPSTLSPEKRIVSTDINDLSELTGELGWFTQMGSILLDNTALVGPAWADVDVNVMLPIREEDQSLFGDLEELAEGSVVFRRALFHGKV